MCVCKCVCVCVCVSVRLGVEGGGDDSIQPAGLAGANSLVRMCCVSGPPGARQLGQQLQEDDAWRTPHRLVRPVSGRVGPPR